MEDLSWSPEREPSAHSFAEEEKVEYEEDEEEGEEEKGDTGEEEEEEEEEEREGGDEKSHVEGDWSIGQVDNSSNRPFILPQIWTMNDFYTTMSQKFFNTLRDHHQIPDHIPFRLPRKFKKCYSGKIADVSVYDAMFAAGLRLPLTSLHCQLANFLGLSVSRIAPKAWRIFIGAKILWACLSGGNR